MGLKPNGIATSNVLNLNLLLLYLQNRTRHVILNAQEAKIMQLTLQEIVWLSDLISKISLLIERTCLTCADQIEVVYTSDNEVATLNGFCFCVSELGFDDRRQK